MPHGLLKWVPIVIVMMHVNLRVAIYVTDTKG